MDVQKTVDVEMIENALRAMEEEPVDLEGEAPRENMADTHTQIHTTHLQHVPASNQSDAPLPKREEPASDIIGLKKVNQLSSF